MIVLPAGRVSHAHAWFNPVAPDGQAISTVSRNLIKAGGGYTERTVVSVEHNPNVEHGEFFKVGKPTRQTDTDYIASWKLTIGSGEDTSCLSVFRRINTALEDHFGVDTGSAWTGTHSLGLLYHMMALEEPKIDVPTIIGSVNSWLNEARNCLFLSPFKSASPNLPDLFKKALPAVFSDNKVPETFMGAHTFSLNLIEGGVKRKNYSHSRQLAGKVQGQNIVLTRKWIDVKPKDLQVKLTDFDVRPWEFALLQGETSICSFLLRFAKFAESYNYIFDSSAPSIKSRIWTDSMTLSLLLHVFRDSI
ncbi:MAG: hypothetical protein WC527_07590 [Candidatus Margulisiibacteriota bacterium]